MTSERWVLLGWAMFTVSGFFFLTDAIETGDKTAFGSAFTWLVGVVCFLAGRGFSDSSEED